MNEMYTLNVDHVIDSDEGKYLRRSTRFMLKTYGEDIVDLLKA